MFEVDAQVAKTVSIPQQSQKPCKIYVVNTQGNAKSGPNHGQLWHIIPQLVP
jgi:hypothetical protein